ncbi:tyrosine-type recombinase/integrase [Pusillimonas sp. TS35]|uniref:tyrosine-type recombinase/integrase n=1 Tax=Paracandidimonas lactea TaxID=2895524 RepID=UPI0013690675|nr:integrase arm-type DNA-binding domain-containing protein [Paracandidimonas lactea]MYN14465.1 tyrosine-type recombinase/integrase [Pusillimonas sp. TS35]
MPRTFTYSLRVAAIEAAKPKDKTYVLTDGGGLHIDVLPSGTKVWRYKYHFGGRRDKITIGRYPAISLKQARQIHEALQAAVEQGGDPKELEFAGFVGTRVKPAGPTFKAYARQWVDETLFYRSAAYRVQQLRWLESYVFGKIGAMPLSSVQPKQILEILDELRPTPTTAEGVRSLIQRIYNYAIRNLQAESNPALMVRGAVSVPKRTHHRHLLEPELARFWRLIPRQGAHFTTQAATQLLVYTMVRKGELIRSRWGEYDLDAAIWDIPAERMKMRKRHRVFLSRQAVELLRLVHTMTGHQEYVFPSIFTASGRVAPMSDVSLNHFFKRMDFGVPDFSPHGIRGTTATLLREHGIRSEVVELLLSHAPRGQVETAYNHAELAEERKQALQFLADYLDKLSQIPD